MYWLLVVEPLAELASDMADSRMEAWICCPLELEKPIKGYNPQTLKVCGALVPLRSPSRSPMNTDIRKLYRASDRSSAPRLQPAMAMARMMRLCPLPRAGVLICFLLSWVLVPSSVQAQQATSGTSSRTAKQQAIDSLPYHQLTERAKQSLNQVLDRPSFYRQLPATSIEADPEYLQFLIRHPEVIVNIWQLMGVTKMSCERSGPFSLRTNDGAGTISDLELMFGSQDLHIFYGRGTYEGSVIRRPISGNCVLIVRTTYQPGPSGTPIATNELNVFLKVDNATANLVARTLQPLIGPTGDHNFVESLKLSLIHI